MKISSTYKKTWTQQIRVNVSQFGEELTFFREKSGLTELSESMDKWIGMAMAAVSGFSKKSLDRIS